MVYNVNDSHCFISLCKEIPGFQNGSVNCFSNHMLIMRMTQEGKAYMGLYAVARNEWCTGFAFRIGTGAKMRKWIMSDQNREEDVESQVWRRDTSIAESTTGECHHDPWSSTTAFPKKNIVSERTYSMPCMEWHYWYWTWCLMRKNSCKNVFVNREVNRDSLQRRCVLSRGKSMGPIRGCNMSVQQDAVASTVVYTTWNSALWTDVEVDSWD